MHVHRRIARELTQIHFLRLFTHTDDLVAWRTDAGNDPDIHLFGEGENTADQGHPRHFRRDWAKGGRIIRFLKEHDAKAVIVEGYQDACRLRIIRWCRGQNIPCFLWGDSNIHGDRTRGLKGILKRLYVGRIIQSVTGVFACGRLGKAFFTKYGAREDRIFLYPVEPDYDLITKLPPDVIEAVRERYSLQSTRKRLIFSGRLALEKRLDLLLAAFAEIAPQRPEWDLILAGTGPLESQLRSNVPPTLEARILWTGFIDRQEVISALYHLSDVLVLPSDYEPWSLAINEATAAGLAIVCSDAVGAAAELVRDHLNGRIFAAGDLAALTACLLDTTAPGRADSMKTASPPLLAEWRRIADPVNGLRQALEFAKVIPLDYSTTIPAKQPPAL